MFNCVGSEDLEYDVKAKAAQRSTDLEIRPKTGETRRTAYGGASLEQLHSTRLWLFGGASGPQCQPTVDEAGFQLWVLRQDGCPALTFSRHS
jgi:hypothetical protein